MRFSEILRMDSVAIIVLITIVVIFLKSKLNITILSEIMNNDINVKLNITYLFKLININIQLYPKNNNKKSVNKNKKSKNKNKGGSKKVSLKDIKAIYKVTKKIEIEEFYSSIEFGNENIEFTCFIYLLINTVYGYIINIINPNKMYLKVIPNFTENYTKGRFKIHIKINFKTILILIINIYKIYKKTKNKEDIKNEGYGFNKKSYGDNS